MYPVWLQVLITAFAFLQGLAGPQGNPGPKGVRVSTSNTTLPLSSVVMDWAFHFLKRWPPHWYLDYCTYCRCQTQMTWQHAVFITNGCSDYVVFSRVSLGLLALLGFWGWRGRKWVMFVFNTAHFNYATFPSTFPTVILTSPFLIITFSVWQLGLKCDVFCLSWNFCFSTLTKNLLPASWVMFHY